MSEAGLAEAMTRQAPLRHPPHAPPRGGPRRGGRRWLGLYGPVGAVQSKVSDAAMAEAMTLQASLGHSCGIGFKAAEHLRKHTEFAWERPALRDMPSRPWTTFSAQ